MERPRETMEAVVPALSLIFWGALIYVVKIRINDFNLVNDFVGMFLLTWGLFWLRAAGEPDGKPSYGVFMLFVKTMAILICFQTLVETVMGVLGAQVIIPPILAFPFWFCTLMALFLFCVSMRWLAEDAGLARASASWKVSTWLVGLFYTPLALLGLFLFMAGSPDIAIHHPIMFLVVLALFIPLIHVLVSLSRMKGDILCMPRTTDKGPPSPLQTSFARGDGNPEGLHLPPPQGEWNPNGR